VTGIGKELAGAGYVRMLNRMWAGKPNLVRVQACSSLWHLSRLGLDLRNKALEWTSEGVELLWSVGGVELLWDDSAYPLTCVPSTDGGWNSLTVSGLPPSTIVARPSELISVTGPSSVESAYALTVTRSDASGVAVIRTDKATPFTFTDLVSIGDKENIVFEALGVPRSVQGATGTFGFQWDMREVFEDEYSDGWTEVDPWA